MLSVIVPVMPPFWPPMVIAPPALWARMPLLEPMVAVRAPVESMFTAPEPALFAKMALESVPAVIAALLSIVMVFLSPLLVRLA